MNKQLKNIESAMETLIQCQSLNGKISKLPKCNYRESLLSCLSNMMSSDFGAEDKPLLAKVPEIPKGEFPLDRVIGRINCEVPLRDRISVLTENPVLIKGIHRCVEDLELAVRAVHSYIEEGSLSLD